MIVLYLFRLRSVWLVWRYWLFRSCMSVLWSARTSPHCWRNTTSSSQMTTMMMIEQKGTWRTFTWYLIYHFVYLVCWRSCVLSFTACYTSAPSWSSETCSTGVDIKNIVCNHEDSWHVLVFKFLHYTNPVQPLLNVILHILNIVKSNILWGCRHISSLSSI